MAHASGRRRAVAWDTVVVVVGGGGCGSSSSSSCSSSADLWPLRAQSSSQASSQSSNWSPAKPLAVSASWPPDEISSRSSTCDNPPVSDDARLCSSASRPPATTTGRRLPSRRPPPPPPPLSPTATAAAGWAGQRSAPKLAPQLANWLQEEPLQLGHQHVGLCAESLASGTAG